MNWVNKFLFDLFEQAEDFYAFEYYMNDIKNEIVHALRNRMTTETLSKCVSTKTNAEIETIIFDELKSLCDKQQFAIQQHYIENKSFYDIYSEYHPRYNSAYYAKLSVQAGMKTMIKNNIVFRLLLDKDRFEFMKSWEDIPISNRYADVADAKILETDLTVRSKEALVRGVLVNARISKDPRRISIADTINNIEDLNDILNCGSKTICDIIKVYDSLGIDTTGWKSKLNSRQLNQLKKV